MVEQDPFDSQVISELTDPPGAMDMRAMQRAANVLHKFGKAYFRYEVRGFHLIPDGPSLLVGNHSGGKIPIDVTLFAVEWHRHFLFRRPLYFLMHDVLFRLNRVTANRLRSMGCVRASPENVRLLLGEGATVMVLPGGEYETFRPYRYRNVVDFSGRTGFVREAIRMGVPITPVVSIGGHEMFFILKRGERIAKLLGFPKWLRVESFPIALGFPLGLYIGPLPAPWPLPSRIVSEILKPVWPNRAEADHPSYHPADHENPDSPRELYDVVISRMQAGMNRLAAERKWPVLG